MVRFPLSSCPDAEFDHKISKRQYAHVFHKPHRTICVCKAFYRLPETYRLAILLHEVGHLIAGPDGNEQAANREAQKASGIPIHYRTSIHGENVEWIDPKYKAQAREFLGKKR